MSEEEKAGGKIRHLASSSFPESVTDRHGLPQMSETDTKEKTEAAAPAETTEPAKENMMTKVKAQGDGGLGRDNCQIRDARQLFLAPFFEISPS